MARDHGWRTNIHLNRQRSRFVSPLEWPIVCDSWCGMESSAATSGMTATLMAPMNQTLPAMVS